MKKLRLPAVSSTFHYPIIAEPDTPARIVILGVNNRLILRESFGRIVVDLADGVVDNFVVVFHSMYSFLIWYYKYTTLKEICQPFFEKILKNNQT